MPHSSINPDQGSFLRPESPHPDLLPHEEAVVDVDQQFPGLRQPPEGLAVAADGEAVDIRRRNRDLVRVLGLLAEEGKMAGLHRTEYLPSYGHERERVESHFGARTPHITSNAGRKSERLAAQAKIVFARAAGYISPEEADNYLALYPDHQVSRGTKPPKEPPLPDAVKDEVNQEFRRFRAKYATPAREGLSKSEHTRNLSRHQRARRAYSGQLKAYIDRIADRDS